MMSEKDFLKSHVSNNDHCRVLVWTSIRIFHVAISALVTVIIVLYLVKFFFLFLKKIAFYRFRWSKDLHSEYRGAEAVLRIERDTEGIEEDWGMGRTFSSPVGICLG